MCYREKMQLQMQQDETAALLWLQIFGEAAKFRTQWRLGEKGELDVKFIKILES